METLAKFLYWEIIVILASFFLVIVFQLFTGRINVKGLFTDKNTGMMDSGRIQQLFFTLITAFYFISKLLKEPTHFPEIPDFLLTLMGGSSLVYLGDKLRSFFKIKG